MSKWPWSSRSPKKHIFKACVTPLTSSNRFCNGRAKRVALVEKGNGPWKRNIVTVKIKGSFQWGREVKDKKIVNLDLFFQTVLFGHISKTSTHSLLMHDHSYWSTFDLHLVRSPKTLWMVLLRIQTMGVEPWSWTTEKYHLPWPDFMVHGVNRALVWSMTISISLEVRYLDLYTKSLRAMVRVGCKRDSPFENVETPCPSWIVAHIFHEGGHSLPLQSISYILGFGYGTSSMYRGFFMTFCIDS